MDQPALPMFDGRTYDHARDQQRLSGMLSRVATVMADNQWHTLRALSIATGGSEAAVSARLRDLRKPRFGGHTIERRYVAHGLWEYRHDHQQCAQRDAT
jgi:hypothetical protein